MSEFAKELISVNLEDEMRRSYVDYAMSVIIGRALPDARDGLKPVHRRVLHAMRELGNDYNKAYKKSARVVGDVIGKYHPHGDTAVYDTIVRMAQPFSLRYLLVDGQGNFGSVDGDSPAAMRYTEVRMSKLAHELLADIDKETVDFVPNYDGSETEPAILPTRLPNLLINGSSGIAVGMATNIPPHNLGEVIDGCVALIDNPEIDLRGLMQLIPAPDFPTAGLILDAHGIVDAYATGRGRLVIRARTSFEDIGNDRQAIIVTELPYQVNKARVLEKIAELVKEKRLEGISELRDESDKDGMRMVIELKRNENAEVVLNNLFQMTQLQTVFGINMVALDGGQPKTLSLKQLLEIFIRHRREVVTRRTRYLLRKARERAHVLEGLAVALANIDEMIDLIRKSAGPNEARAGLMSRSWTPGPVSQMLERAGATASRPADLSPDLGLVRDAKTGKDMYRLSEAQAQAILDLRLHRLTGLEQEKIHEEYKQLLESIADYLDILGSTARLMSVIRGELLEMKEQYGDERRTEITQAALDIQHEDLITPQDMVVTLSHEGYVKTVPLDEYRAQKRGGRGKQAASNKDEDFVDRLWIAHTHDTLLCFSSAGKCYRLRVFELPSGSRGSRGKPFNNMLPLEAGEKINAVQPIKSFEQDGKFIFMATRRGTVKKTELAAFANVRASGIIAVDLRVDDALVDVALTSGGDDVILISDAGRAIRFNEADVRAMGRGATGVRGIKLIKTFAGSEDESEDTAADAAETDDSADTGAADSARVIALIVPSAAGGDVLTVSELGFGKRTPLDQFPRKGRGGQGVIGQQLNDKTGRLIGAIVVDDSHEIMLISEKGVLIRTRAAEVRIAGRNTQGVRLMRPDEGDRLVGVDRIETEGEEGNGTNGDGANGNGGAESAGGDAAPK
ncbi:MAG TPA: DNA gyrase subunit A [Nevskiaceae bacterium]|nr:DNA gyrase subunit A [Nevskiaceae bacterium]